MSLRIYDKHLNLTFSVVIEDLTSHQNCCSMYDASAQTNVSRLTLRCKYHQFIRKTSSCKVRSIIEAFVCALITARDSTEFFVNHLRCESLTHFKSLLESFSHETNYSQLNLFFANFSRKTSLASRVSRVFELFTTFRSSLRALLRKSSFTWYQDELQSLSRELGKI